MEKGYIALITILIIMAVVTTTASTVALLAIGEAQSGFAVLKGEDTLSFVEGCAEDALLKARQSPSYIGGTITRPQGTCSISISKINIPWTMTVTTTETNYKRTIQIKYTWDSTGITLSTWKEI